MASNESGTLIGVSKLAGPRKIFEQLTDAYAWALEDRNTVHDIFSPYTVVPSELGLEGDEPVVPNISGQLLLFNGRQSVQLTVNERTVIVLRHTADQPQGVLSVSSDERSFMDLVFNVNPNDKAMYDRGLVWLHTIRPTKPLVHLRLLPVNDIPDASLDRLLEAHSNAHQEITSELRKILTYKIHK